MHRFELDVLAADVQERIIEGVVIPYGEIGTVEGKRFRFAAGAASPGRARTPLLLDHDRSKPVGVLADFEQTDTGAFARFRIDPTPLGDDALATAASGSRGAFSIGAELDDLDERSDPVNVRAARIMEVSLLPIGAYAGAAVTRVAAEYEQPDPDPEPDPDAEPDPNQERLPVEQEPDTPAPPAEPEGGTMQEAAAAPVIYARADKPNVELGAGELVSLMIRAQHGEHDAARYLEAVLAESISTDLTGLLPPVYERTVIGGKEVARPLYNAFRGRPLPGVGLNINKPKWTTPPNGAWAPNVDADATTSTVVIGSQSAAVQRWDWAGAIPWVVVQRSDPSVIDAIYAEAVQDFYYDVEAKIYGELGAAAPGVATTMGAALAEFYTATGNQRAAEVIIMAPDVWGDYADSNAMNVSVLQGGVSTDELSVTIGGVRAVSSGTLAPGETVLATRRAVDVRITEPVRLTANAIGALNVELAVVGEGIFDTDYPAELLKFAALVPAVARPA